MTTLPFTLVQQYLASRHEVHDQLENIDCRMRHHDEVFLMKALLLGMMIATLGAETAVLDSNDDSLRKFGMCLAGGILGMIVGISCFKPKDVQAMAQEICGNLCAAIAFGPGATFYVAARCSATPDVYWFVATSAALGICGLSLVKAVKSDFVAWILSKSGLTKQPEFIPPPADPPKQP